MVSEHGGGGPGKAAGLGALGCLGAFLLIGFLFVLAGGSVYIDGGGFIILIVLGAIIGLIVYAIYSKGRSDATRYEPPGRYAPPSSKSIDELIAEAEKAFRAGLVTREEYERLCRRAWGHRD
jgi:hypothetical protein